MQNKLQVCLYKPCIHFLLPNDTADQDKNNDLKLLRAKFLGNKQCIYRTLFLAEQILFTFVFPY